MSGDEIPIRIAAQTIQIAMPLTVIRSFQNADLPNLHRLWLEHWSMIGPPPSIGEAQLEQALLARTFFRPEQLLVMESESQPSSGSDGASGSGAHASAWLQFLVSPEESETIVIPAICLGESSTASDAISLLEEAHRRARDIGASKIEVGIVRDNLFGYAGIDPVGHGAGIPSSDPRMQEALTATGYRPESSSRLLAVSVPDFRPPVSREALQLRRSAKVESSIERHAHPRNAASMSHFDVETNRLIDRSGTELASLQCWFSDPEAEVMSPTRMIVDLGEAQERGSMTAAESFLLGSVIQAVNERNILAAETVVDEDQKQLLESLEKLQFRCESSGSLWVRDL